MYALSILKFNATDDISVLIYRADIAFLSYC